jgi:hypothetical protein
LPGDKNTWRARASGSSCKKGTGRLPTFRRSRFCKFDQPRTLSFTWAGEPFKPGWNETQVALDFQPQDVGTNVVLTHEHFRSEPDKRDRTNGWRGCLRRLSVKFGA